GFVGKLDGGDQVVGIELAALAGGDAVDPLGLLIGPAGEPGLEGEHVAVAVVRVFRGLVVGIAGRAVNVGLDSLRRLAQVVVVGLGHDAAGVGGGFDEAGGAIGVAGDEGGVGAAGHARRPRVGRAAVGGKKKARRTGSVNRRAKHHPSRPSL